MRIGLCKGATMLATVPHISIPHKQQVHFGGFQTKRTSGTTTFEDLNHDGHDGDREDDADDDDAAADDDDDVKNQEGGAQAVEERG